MTAAAWTCPFCPLACDHLGVRVGQGALALEGGRCERAQRGLSGFHDPPAPATALVDGQAASLDAAIAAAAQRLAASRQPLFAGLVTDVAGARALYPLACATGAICDGDAVLVPTLRALQDRGQFTATLAEVRTRADVIVFVGGLPLAQAPLIGERCGIGEDAGVEHRHVVVLAPQPGDEAALAAWAGPRVSVEVLPLQDDLFGTLAQLALPAPPAPLSGLAERLACARYAVFIGCAASWPREGALVAEAVNRVVARLNRSTRAAALWIGSSTANQVFAWLSGLPLRSRWGPQALEHEPLLFDTQRLLRDGVVDALLWVSAFEPLAPPASDLPLIALGPPALADACRRAGAVFIPVGTPGIGTDGHVFRTDGTVMMPLHALRADGLPSVAEVARRVQAALGAHAS